MNKISIKAIYGLLALIIGVLSYLFSMPTSIEAATCTQTGATSPPILKANSYVKSSVASDYPGNPHIYYVRLKFQLDDVSATNFSIKNETMPGPDATTEYDSLATLEKRTSGYVVDQANKTVTVQFGSALPSDEEAERQYNANNLFAEGGNIISFKRGGRPFCEATIVVGTSEPTPTIAIPDTPTPTPANCRLVVSPSGILSDTDTVYITISANSTDDLRRWARGDDGSYYIYTSEPDHRGTQNVYKYHYLSPSDMQYDSLGNLSTIRVDIGKYEDGKTVDVNFYKYVTGFRDPEFCAPTSFIIGEISPTPDPLISSTPTPPPELKNVCQNVSLCGGIRSDVNRERCQTECGSKDDPDEQASCAATYSGGDERLSCNTCLLSGRAYTAIGCIPTNPSEFMQEYLFNYGAGIAAGVAFLLMLWGGFYYHHIKR